MTFLLGKGCHNREQDFALRIHGVDGFLFKIDKIAGMWKSKKRGKGLEIDVALGMGNDEKMSEFFA